MRILQFPIMTMDGVHGDIARFYRKFREYAGDLDSKKSSLEEASEADEEARKAAVKCVRFCRAGIAFFAGRGDVVSVDKIIDHFAVYLSEVVEAGRFESTKQYSILDYVYDDDSRADDAGDDEEAKHDAAVKKYCHKGWLAAFKEANFPCLVKGSKERLSWKEKVEQTRLVGEFFECFIELKVGRKARAVERVKASVVRAACSVWHAACSVGHTVWSWLRMCFIKQKLKVVVGGGDGVGGGEMKQKAAAGGGHVRRRPAAYGGYLEMGEYYDKAPYREERGGGKS